MQDPAQLSMRVRAWIFTLHRPGPEVTPEWYAGLEARYILVGDEIAPTTGNPHHQGYIYFGHAVTGSALRKRMRYVPAEGGKATMPWVRSAKGSAEENHTYCTKEKIFYEAGDKPAQGRRGDIDDLYDMVDAGKSLQEITDVCRGFSYFKMAQNLLTVRERKRDWVPEVWWIWGPTGTGKSHLAREWLGKDAYCTSGNLKFWEGYDADENVIIEDFRPHHYPYDCMLRLLDRYPVRVEVKHGSRQCLAKRFAITCPFSPERCFKNCGEAVDQLLRRITKVIHLSVKYVPPGSVEGQQEGEGVGAVPDDMDAPATCVQLSDEELLGTLDELFEPVEGN